MKRSTCFSILGLAMFTSFSASAAIFDSLESVDQLKVIAEQRTQKTDRMPAGKVADPAAEQDADATAVPAEVKKEN